MLRGLGTYPFSGASYRASPESLGKRGPFRGAGSGSTSERDSKGENIPYEFHCYFKVLFERAFVHCIQGYVADGECERGAI